MGRIVYPSTFKPVSAHGLAGGILSATLATFARSLPVPSAAISASLHRPPRGTLRRALCAERIPAPGHPSGGSGRKSVSGTGPTA
jgi:hypothetical protein